MSRQLSRIRSLISEIDEIQRQGQLKVRLHPILSEETVSGTSPAIRAVSTPKVEPGRISLSLKHNVIVELNIEDGSESVGEIVEIKKGDQGLEILFRDGKAFHIPFKDVA